MSRPHPYVDAEPYTAFVGRLLDEGFWLSDLARVSRLDRKTIRDLAAGRKVCIQQRTAERVRLLLDLLPV